MIEISPRTSQFFVNGPRTSDTTIKISGTGSQSHDDALTALESLGTAFLFDIDVRYGLSFELAKRPAAQNRERRASPQTPPRFPANRYAAEPLALYRYGRAAKDLPLLEFLAYYQVMEFFFPIFTREAVIRRLRIALRDPQIDTNDDSDLARIVSLIQPSGRIGGNERDQLRGTVMACVEPSWILEYMEENEERKNHFCKRQPLPSSPPVINLRDGQQDLRIQLSDRIYYFRCRIVHTKQDSDDAGIDLLLPSSKEAQSLWRDIELLRILAQKALIAGAGR